MNEETIFSKAVLIDSHPERDKFLTQACAGDARMLAKVRQLLSLHEEAGSFLEKSPVSQAVEPTVVSGDTHDDEADGSNPVTLSAFPGVDLSFLTASKKPGCLGTIDQYEVTGVIGEGGMGLVLKALDTKLHRTVALKFLAPQLAANGNARKRFLREAVAAAAVVHPHVVTIHGVDQGPLPFLVMEYVSGVSLREKLDKSGALDIKEILRIGCQIAAGLAAAHHQGLIHRDIKPGNILLENGVQRVKITDFGLARAADDLSVTRTGEVSGTPQYMSPEQARGDQIDQRSDLFSMGSVMYAMCTGRAPFRADTTMGVLKRVCEDEPRPIRELNQEIPDWLEAIVGKLLEKNPQDRFQSAAEVSEVLSHALAHVQQPTQVSRPAYKYGRNRSVESPWSRYARYAVLVPVLLMALIGATLVSVNVLGAVLFYFTGAKTSLTITPPQRTNGSIGPQAPTRPTPPVASEQLSGANGQQPPPLAVLPFDANQAARHQQDWADHLGLPVEFTNSVGITFRLIPPGDFMMGEGPGFIEQNKALYPDDAYWRFIIDSSGPVHRVRITQPYYMATTEVTVEQFGKVLEQTKYVTAGERLHPHERNWRTMAEGTTPKCPVGYLTWGDSAEFCRALSQIDGMSVELPTEAQWEYACRAGSNSRWCYGDDPSLLAEYAWFDQPNPGTIAEVGVRKPNAFGLHDMHGNISEWCRDWHQRDFYSRSPVDDPFFSDDLKSPDVRSQVLRGGRWLDKAELVSSGCPRHYSSDVQNAQADYGFRPAITGDLTKVIKFAEPTRASETPTAIESVSLTPLDFSGSTIDGEQGVFALQISKDGKRVVTGHYGGDVVVWSVATRREKQVIPAHQATVQGLQLTENGEFAATSAEDGTVHLWNLDGRELVRQFEKHDSRVDSLVFLEEENLLVSASADHDQLEPRDRAIRVWDVTSGELKWEHASESGVVVGMVSLGDQLAVLTSSPGRLTLIDLETGVASGHLDVSSPLSLARSAQGDLLAVGHAVESLEPSPSWDSEDCDISLIDPKTLTVVRTLNGHHSPVADLDFSPDGNWIASVSGGSFTSDGTFLEGADSTLRIWDVRTGQELGQSRSDDRLLRVAFLPNSRQVVTGGNRRLRLWNIHPMKWQPE